MDCFEEGVKCTVKRGKNGKLYLVFVDNDCTFDIAVETGLFVACFDNYEDAIELPKINHNKGD